MKTILELLKDMPEYNCHKVVQAAKITDFIGNKVELEGNIKAWMKRAFMQKHDPKIGGYIVLYDNDYLSYSPAKVFEHGYKIKDLMSEIKPQAQERNYAVPYIITPEFDLTKKIESVMDIPEYQDRSHYIAHPSGLEVGDKVFFIVNSDDFYYWMSGEITEIYDNYMFIMDISKTVYEVASDQVFYTLNDLLSVCESNGINLENNPTHDQYSQEKDFSCKYDVLIVKDNSEITDTIEIGVKTLNEALKIAKDYKENKLGYLGYTVEIRVDWDEAQ